MKIQKRLAFIFMATFALGGLTRSAMAEDSNGNTDAKTQCYPEEESKAILSEFSFNIRDPKLKFDPCDESNLVVKTMQGLNFIKALPISTSALDGFDNGKLRPSIYEFFKSRISIIKFESVQSSAGACDRFTAAYVYASLNGKLTHDATMHICPIAANQNALNLSSVLIHESRHQDGFLHVNCQHGYFGSVSTIAACDDSYEKAGSYGIQAEYYVNLSRQPQLNEAIRQYSRGEAINQFMDRFNKLPLGMKRGAIAMTDSGEGSFFDGSSLTRLFSAGVDDDVLLTQQHQLVRFSSKNQDFQTSLDGKLWTERRAIESKTRIDFIDNYANGGIACELSSHLMSCDDGKKQTAIEIKDFNPTGFATHEADSLTGNAIYVSALGGDVYYLSILPNGRLGTATKLIKSKSFTQLIGFSKIGAGQALLLNSDGRLAVSALSKSNPAINGMKATAAIPGIDPTLHFKNLMAPYYWSSIIPNL